MASKLLASILNFNGKRGINLGAPQADNDTARRIDVDTAATEAKSRANHTGTQIASTISNFDTAVRTNRLDQMAVPTNPVSFNSQRAANVADPANPQDAATKVWVETQLAGLSGGQITKGTVVVSVDTNVDIASPGATLDGVSMSVGQEVLLFGQTVGTQNGPYVWNGATLSMTRTTNWDTTSDAKLGSYWIVMKGTRAESFALMTNDTFTLGTDTLAVGHIPIVPSKGVPHEVDLGNGAATSFTLTHNFETKSVGVVVFRNASPYDEIDVYVSRPNVNQVTVEPDDVWTTNQMHAIVWKL